MCACGGVPEVRWLGLAVAQIVAKPWPSTTGSSTLFSRKDKQGFREGHTVWSNSDRSPQYRKRKPS